MRYCCCWSLGDESRIRPIPSTVLFSSRHTVITHNEMPNEVLSDFHVREHIMCPFKGSERNICPSKGNHIILLLLAYNFLRSVVITITFEAMNTKLNFMTRCISRG